MQSLNDLPRDIGATTASTLSFVDGKVRAIVTNTRRVPSTEEGKSPPKLFGVPLHGNMRSEPMPMPCEAADFGKKRPRGELWEDVCVNDLVLPRITSSAKWVKTELALGLRPSTVEAPWLQISASRRDKSVYIWDRYSQEKARHQQRCSNGAWSISGGCQSCFVVHGEREWWVHFSRTLHCFYKRAGALITESWLPFIENHWLRVSDFSYIKWRLRAFCSDC